MQIASDGVVRAIRKPAPRVRAFAVGAVALLLLLIWLARPVVQHWRATSSELEAARAEFVQLREIVNNRSTVDSTVLRQERLLAPLPQRVLRARSRALAASALQSLVLELAESSNVTISRLDVAGLDSTGDLPFDVSANGDIYGLTELLQRIRTARYVVVVRKLQVQNNSALRGAADVLQFSFSLQAPVIVQ